MKKTIHTIVALLWLNVIFSQTVTLTTSTTIIAEHESTVLTATLDAATSQDVIIDFDVSGTAINDLDYIVDYLGIGEATTVAGGNGPGSADNQFNNPSGIFLDLEGNIYIGDLNNYRVQKWASGATEGITVAGVNGMGSAANQFSYPSEIFVDLNGNIYVADRNNHRVQKWAPGATEGITVAGGNGSGSAANQLWNPYGISVDLNGNIYVADNANDRIQKWAPGVTEGVTVAGGNGVGSLANQLYNPLGIFVDLEGSIYISDNGNNRIQKWAPGVSEGITVAGGNGSGSAANQLSSSHGIFVDLNGNIYVVDRNNHRVQKWAPGATEGITVAGGNGSGSAANQLWNPYGISVDLNGNIYIADDRNNRIQKYQYAPQIIIPAGETTGTLTINGIVDTIDENDETIIITPTNTTNATLSDSTPVSITLSDLTDPPTITFALSEETIVENSPVDVTLTATLSTISAKDITIEFSMEGTATNTSEYALSSTTISILAGVTTGNLTVSTSGLDDTLVEVLEDIVFRVNTITNATTVTETITLNLISDDDPIVTIVPSLTSIAEHESATITATLDAATSQDVIINFDVSGTAINDLDYIVDYLGKGEATTVAGGNGAGSADNQLNYPYGIFLDLEGNIYVGDLDNHRVQKWASGATEGITVAGGNGQGSAANQFSYPSEIFVDLNGNIYVVDKNNHRVQKWAPGATEGITVAGGNGSGSAANQLWNPYGISVDLNGNIYVADTANDRIQKWTPGVTEGITVAGGNGQGSAGNQLKHPLGIFVDLEGSIYISDNGNNRIQKWALGVSEGITVAGGNGSGSAANQLSSSYGIFVDLNGNIYVVDQGGNHRIQKWAPGATEGITVAGGNVGGSINNQLSFPTDIFLDSGGNIYVTDSFSNRVRKYQYAPQIVIPAGETTGTFTINGIEDELNDEGEETIIVTINSATNTDITNVQDITITILDNTKTLTVQENPFIGLSNGAVSWGDYDRDGDKDVAVMGQSNLTGAVTAIYENQDGVFVNTNQNFTKLYGGDITWVDINKDSWIDLVVSGYNGTPQTNLYINVEGQYFEPTNDYNLPQLFSSKMAWGDLDNDGDIDLAIAGIDGQNNYVFNIYYREDDQDTFILEPESMNVIPGFINGDLKIVDVDLDGDNDIVYNGENASGTPVGGIKYNSLIKSTNNLSIPSLKNSTIEVVRMNSNLNSLSIITSGVNSGGTIIFNADPFLVGLNLGSENQFPNLKDGDIAIGDFNNDGTNDIVLTGENQDGLPITKLYIQDENGDFTESEIELEGLRESTANWVDYDMDGDLDLFLTGLGSSGAKTLLYESDIANKANTPPAKITGLIAQDLGNGKIRFSWDTPTDDFSSNLGYVLRLGTTPGGTELSNTESDLITGTRLITKNAPIYTNFFETLLDPGNYYWAVQAVDTGLKGGEFSTEEVFSLTYEWKFLNQGGIIDKSINGVPNPVLKLADLDNDDDLDLIYGSTSGGTQLFKYSGKRLDRVSHPVESFQPVNNIEVGDVNNDGTTDILLNNSNSLGLFLSNADTHTQINIDQGLYNAKSKIFDINNDGQSEVIFSGVTNNTFSGIPKLYVYEYDNTSFIKTDVSNQIASLKFGSFDMGDVDNDQDIDFTISGFNDTQGLQSFIYENVSELGGSFTLSQTSINLAAVREGTTDLIDFDSDGDLDAIFTGTSTSGDVFEIYLNKLNEGITTWPRLNNIGLLPMREGKVDLGDFNGDGYSDLLYSGVVEGQGKITKLSEFDPIASTYIESAFDVSMFIDAEVEFGDLDGDGDLDFAIAGENRGLSGNYLFSVYINVRNESASVIVSGSGRSANNVKGNSLFPNTFIVNNSPSIPVPIEIKPIVGGTINEDGVPVELSWQPSTDDNTPIPGLTYAIKIGTTPGAGDVMSANANSNGIRKTAEKGNVEHNLKWQLRLLPGDYYWSVQAIDASYSGSEFSDSRQFEITSLGSVVLDLDDWEIVNDLKIYPNPTSDILNINSQIEIEKVVLFDILGKQILETTKTLQLDLSELSKGIYLLNVYSVKGKVVKKIIVE